MLCISTSLVYGLFFLHHALPQLHAKRSYHLSRIFLEKLRHQLVTDSQNVTLHAVFALTWKKTLYNRPTVKLLIVKRPPAFIRT